MKNREKRIADKYSGFVNWDLFDSEESARKKQAENQRNRRATIASPFPPNQNIIQKDHPTRGHQSFPLAETNNKPQNPTKKVPPAQKPQDNLPTDKKVFKPL